jgi:AbrB family looped-hinge helix DNA binding protein
VAQLSARGTVTLPAEVRRSLGLSEADVLSVTVTDGRIVLTPAVVTPVELYTEDRTAEFAANSEMTEAELARARRRWDQRGSRG